MIISEWQRIRYFSDRDNWGTPSLMDFDFVHTLDTYRAFHGFPMIVTSGTQGKHEEHSLHYSGFAGDFIFITLSLPQLFDRFIDASRFGFSEIGIYPHWKYNGRTTGGIHLGKARTVEGNEVPRKKIWLRVPGAEGKDEQLAVTVENLARWGFLSA